MSLPDRTKPLHLLRALLRECTHLPDPQARRHVSRSILARYRSYQRPPPGPGKDDPSASSSRFPQTRIRSALDSAKAAHSLLVRANNGGTKPLLKVLLHTYGRAGKRRHELLDRLRYSPCPGSHGDGQPPHVHALAPQVVALARSQRKQRPLDLTRPRIKELEPRIPATNSWKRPLPQKRRKNILLKFQKNLLDRILPPLPEKEWHRLESLATGALPWEGPRVRRSRAGAELSRLHEGHSLLTEGLLRLEVGKQREFQINRLGRADRPHNITQRFMQRLWAKVFSQCPVMRWEDEKQAWHIQWGNLGGLQKGVQTVRNQDESALFHGVDGRGNRIEMS